MILSDRDIRRRLEKGELRVEPLDDPELQIQPASIDMRLGNEFLEFERSNIPCIHPEREEETDEYTRRRVVENGEDYVLHPGDFVLGTTYETVEIPDDLVARVEGRSSLGRLAVVVHATAGFVDPGYRGQITLELSNLGTAPVALRPEEMRISQLVLTELSSPAEEPYGEERGSKYQDQDGPTASRIGEDAEWKKEERENDENET
jgi:dCTP deaminase